MSIGLRLRCGIDFLVHFRLAFAKISVRLLCKLYRQEIVSSIFSPQLPSDSSVAAYTEKECAFVSGIPRISARDKNVQGIREGIGRYVTRKMYGKSADHSQNRRREYFYRVPNHCFNHIIVNIAVGLDP